MVYEGTYGTLVVQSNGRFSYVLNPDDPDTAALTEPLDTFFVHVTDAEGRDCWCISLYR